jgi:hypothetical protein
LPDGVLRSQVKLRNQSRRHARNLNLVIRLHAPGLVKKGVTENITLREFRVPEFSGRKDYRLTVRPEGATALTPYYKYLPLEIVEQHRQGGRIDLKALVECGQDWRIQAFVTGYDAYSSSVGFAKGEYRIEAFRTGRFLEDSCDHTGVLHETEDGDTDPLP